MEDPHSAPSGAGILGRATAGPLILIKRGVRATEPAGPLRCQAVTSALDVSLLLATVLLRVALVLATFGIVLLVGGLAVDFVLACLIL